MRKIKEILRLRYDLKLGQVQIARSCNLGPSTGFRYLQRFEESGLAWPLPADCSNRLLEELLLARPGPRPALDFAAIDRQLQTHQHTSLQLLWKECRAQQPGGYQYSYFCELYRRWKTAQGVVLQ